MNELEAARVRAAEMAEASCIHAQERDEALEQCDELLAAIEPENADRLAGLLLRDERLVALANKIRAEGEER